MLIHGVSFYVKIWGLWPNLFFFRDYNFTTKYNTQSDIIF